ncbi:MAG: right-handed parallel beta-helix repeat-containing protein [Candidatus Omnitrophica bacterium]|nr:right-handed parallel beta-helix repeat-containing protein [Candidatus Omnitrophota bacterium]
MRLSSFCFVFLFTALPGLSATWTVGPGTSFVFPTLTAALIAASSGDELFLAGETFDVTSGEDFPIRLRSGIRIAALNPGDRPLIHGDGESSVLHGEDLVGIVLEGLEIRGGKGERGGGMYAKGLRGVIRDCVFSYNEAVAGGGLSLEGGGTIIEDCTFEHNHTTGVVFNLGGGCGMETRGGFHDIHQCTFRHNSTLPGETPGGGLSMFSEGTVQDCQFLDNGQTAYGAGAFLGRPVTVERCKFVGNVAKFWGGGAYIYYTSVTIRDCLFTLNRSVFPGDGGGGLACQGRGIQRVDNCLFIGNMAVRGGAVVTFDRSTVQITNCLMGGNLAGASGLAAVNGSYPFVSYCTFYSNYLPCVRADDSSDLYLAGCLFDGNSSYDLVENGPYADVLASYCYFHNETDGVFKDDQGTVYTDVSEIDGTVNGFSDNLQGGSVFPEPLKGSWTEEAAFDEDKYQTTLVDADADWTPGQFKERISFLNPNQFQNPNFMVIDNTETTLTVWGNAAAYMNPGDQYTLRQVSLSRRFPGIDRGPTTGPDADLFGNPRPVDIVGQGREGENAFDIGAIEIAPGPPIMDFQSDINQDGRVDAKDLLILESDLKDPETE